MAVIAHCRRRRGFSQRCDSCMFKPISPMSIVSGMGQQQQPCCNGRTILHILVNYYENTKLHARKVTCNSLNKQLPVKVKFNYYLIDRNYTFFDKTRFLGSLERERRFLTRLFKPSKLSQLTSIAHSTRVQLTTCAACACM